MCATVYVLCVAVHRLPTDTDTHAQCAAVDITVSASPPRILFISSSLI